MFRRRTREMKDSSHWFQPNRFCSVMRPTVRMVGIAAAFFGGMSLSPALSHEGPDLEPGAAATTNGFARLAAHSENFELVGVVNGAWLTLYLDRFQDNAPVTDAKITVAINDETETTQPDGEGAYVVTSRKFADGGLFEFVFDIKAPETDDLLIAKLTLPQAVTANGATAAVPWYGRAAGYLRHGAEDHLVLMSLVLVAGIGLGLALHRRRPRPIALLLLATGTFALVGHSARAHDEHLEGATALPGKEVEISRRLSDGRTFVPKPTQRILNVRTVIAKPETIPRTALFVGRIIADPNRSGLVQSITGGRVIAAEQGLPRIGQAVAKGELLASIEPPMAIADRTTISERMGEIEQAIAVAEAKLKRFRAMAERSVSPQSFVVETEAELDGLYRRRDAVREARATPEVLRAPIDGVVAMSRVVAGQVVQAQDVLFQIVDPGSLWIEAFDYGETDPATLKHPTALAPGNVAIKLAFEGWSRALQQQATVLRFAILDPPSALRVGQPVTVTAERGDTTTGVIIDREAVVRGANGEPIVWRHTEPEYFEARRVRVEPFDATRVLVAAGIADGDRIVVEGAALIEQVR